MIFVILLSLIATVPIQSMPSPLCTPLLTACPHTYPLIMQITKIAINTPRHRVSSSAGHLLLLPLHAMIGPIRFFITTATTATDVVQNALLYSLYRFDVLSRSKQGRRRLMLLLEYEYIMHTSLLSWIVDHASCQQVFVFLYIVLLPYTGGTGLA